MIGIGSKKQAKGKRVVFRVKDKYVFSDDVRDKPLVLTVAYMLDKGLKTGAIRIDNTGYIIKLSEDTANIEEVEVPEGTDFSLFVESLEGEEAIEPITPEFSKWEEKYQIKAKTKIYVYAGLVVVAFLILFLAYSKHKVMKKQKKVQPSQIVVVRMTPQERKERAEAVSYMMLRRIVEKINGVKEGERIRSMQGSLVTVQEKINKNTVKEALIGKLNIMYETVYPVKGSLKSGEFFTRKEEEEIRRRSVPRGKLSLEDCGMELLKRGIELYNPDTHTFRGTTKSWEDSKDLLETLQNCNIEIKSIAIVDGKLRMEAVLHD